MALPLHIKQTEFVRRLDRMSAVLKREKITASRGHAREVIAVAIGFANFTALVEFLKKQKIIPKTLIDALDNFHKAFRAQERQTVIPANKPEKPAPKKKIAAPGPVVVRRRKGS